MKNILLFMSDKELDLKGYFDFVIPKLDCQRLKENYLLIEIWSVSITEVPKQSANPGQ